MSQTQACACCTSDGQTGVDQAPTCYCALDGVLETLSRRHALQVVALLGSNGPTRYTDLESRLDATSSSTLSDCLATLSEAGLIERRSFDEVPPRVEYSLTPAGRELEERLQPLLAWAAEH